MRAVTFNILHGKSRTGRVDAGLLDRACASLDADVLALQEVDAGVARSGGADQAGSVAEATGMAYAFGPAKTLGGGEYGNALLVRGRLDDVEVLPLPQGWRDEPRSAVLATAEVGGTRLSVAATHLSWRPRSGPRQLRAVLASLSARPLPRLLLGDLNLLPGDVEPLTAAAGLALAGGEPTFPASLPVRQLDHIAVAGLTVVSCETVALPVSDHLALVAELGPGVSR